MHAGELAELDYLRSLAQRLAEAGHGRRGPIASAAMRHLGCSRDALYRKLRSVGWSSGRALRADKGDACITEAAVREVAALCKASTRATGKVLLPVRDAIEIAVANGLLSKPVAESTMHRLMRRYNCHPGQMETPSAHSSMRSLYPNHVWQLDASICVLYYLRNGKVGVMDERTFNARKPAGLVKIGNLRLLRYAITDHSTGSTVARYYNAAGEDQDTLFQFLMHAFSKREGDPVHGVPEMLVWDAGAANQCKGIGALLDALQVRHWAHVPGNSRAKGQVECTHNIIERSFEGRLTFERIDSVEQLNAHLDTWLCHFNGAREHSRHKHTRWGLWQTIRAEQLRLCPPLEDCRDALFGGPQPRKVKGNLTIQFTPRGHPTAAYSVADVPGVRVGETLQVVTNLYRLPNVCVIVQDENGATRYVECTPIATDAYGFFADAPVYGESYRAPADSAVDQSRKQANLAAFGVADDREALERKKKGELAFGGRIDAFKDLRQKADAVPEFIQRRGTQIDMPNPVQIEVKPLGLVDVLIELQARVGRPLSEDESARVRQLVGTGIPAEQLDRVIEQTLAAPRPFALAVVK